MICKITVIHRTVTMARNRAASSQKLIKAIDIFFGGGVGPVFDSKTAAGSEESEVESSRMLSVSIQ